MKCQALISFKKKKIVYLILLGSLRVNASEIPYNCVHVLTVYGAVSQANSPTDIGN